VKGSEKHRSVASERVTWRTGNLEAEIDRPLDKEHLRVLNKGLEKANPDLRRGFQA
jgi:hypothetical protein